MKVPPFKNQFNSCLGPLFIVEECEEGGGDLYFFFILIFLHFEGMGELLLRLL